MGDGTGGGSGWGGGVPNLTLHCQLGSNVSHFMLHSLQGGKVAFPSVYQHSSFQLDLTGSRHPGRRGGGVCVWV